MPWIALTVLACTAPSEPEPDTPPGECAGAFVEAWIPLEQEPEVAVIADTVWIARSTPSEVSLQQLDCGLQTVGDPIPVPIPDDLVFRGLFPGQQGDLMLTFTDGTADHVMSGRPEDLPSASSTIVAGQIWKARWADGSFAVLTRLDRIATLYRVDVGAAPVQLTEVDLYSDNDWLRLGWDGSEYHLGNCQWGSANECVDTPVAPDGSTRPYTLRYNLFFNHGPRYVSMRSDEAETLWIAEDADGVQVELPFDPRMQPWATENGNFFAENDFVHRLDADLLVVESFYTSEDSDDLQHIWPNDGFLYRTLDTLRTVRW